MSPFNNNRNLIFLSSTMAFHQQLVLFTKNISNRRKRNHPIESIIRKLLSLEEIIMMRSTNEEEERNYKEHPDNCYHSNRKKAKCCTILFLLEVVVIIILTASSCIDGLQFSSTKSIPTSSSSVKNAVTSQTCDSFIRPPQVRTSKKKQIVFDLITV